MSNKAFEVLQNGNSKECFYMFVEILTKPYAQVKQYFEPLILEIDYYHDLKHFHQYYLSQNDKDKDTIYQNLSRLYDYVNNDLSRDTKDINKFIKSNTAFQKKVENLQSLDFEKFLKENSKVVEYFNYSLEKSKKVTLLTNMLNACDYCRQSQQSVPISRFEITENSLQQISEIIEKDFKLIKENNSTLQTENNKLIKKIEKIKFEAQIRLLVVVFMVLMLPVFLYIVIRFNFKNAIFDFFEKVFWGYIIGGVSILGWLMPKNIKNAFKSDDDKKDK